MVKPKLLGFAERILFKHGRGARVPEKIPCNRVVIVWLIAELREPVAPHLGQVQAVILPDWVE
jgi:hypothetical protein